jgi:hypothetical protein
MKRSTLMMLAFTALCGAANAQYWKAMGRGTIASTEVQTLYGDSISDRLLAGGTFLWIMNETDTVLGVGQAAWNGTRWDSIAHRIQPIDGNSTHQTYWFLRFQGRLYACGSFVFQTPNGEWNSSLARLNEGTEVWEALECPITDPLSGIEQWVPKVPDTTLYATGYIGYQDEFCGFPLSCVYRYDGSAFHSWEPFGQIPFNADNYVGYVFDYQGMTYLTGSVRDPLGPGIVTFLRWNGSSWEHVPGWNTQSPIKEILIHNDTLYVAGTFRFATGGPGDLIASFDGENWNDLGGGLSYPPVPMSGAALDLEWWHGDLLVCGRFIRAGGANCTGIAKWNGNQWCSFAGILQGNSGFDARLTDMAIWRDSLYICGGINTIDGDTIRQVAQWIGGDATGDCSTVGIHETAGPPAALVVTPQAEPGRWTVHFPSHGAWTLSAFDVMGRSVGTWNSHGTQMVLDLADRSRGIYLLRAISAAGEIRSAKVVRP